MRDGLIALASGNLTISERDGCWKVVFNGADGGPSWSFHCTIYHLLMVLGGLRYYIAGADGSCELRRKDDAIQISTLFGDHVHTIEVPVADYERVIKGLSFAHGDIFLI